jgi:hypothetical protein
MGGDGQSLLNNRKLLENLYHRQGKDAANVSAVDRQNRLQYCAMSHEPLTKPVCCDLRGNLYNRAAAVKYILDRKADPTLQKLSSPLIERLKDVRSVLEPTASAATDEEVGEPFELVCAATGRRSAGGRFPFACSWACGHVICAGEDEDLMSRDCPVCQHNDNDDGDVLKRRVWVRLGLDKDAGDEQRAALSSILHPKRQRE